MECACFGFERLIFGLWPRAGRKESFTWIAEADGKPTGYLIAYNRNLRSNPVMYVGGVGVLPQYRKRGIASQLMGAVLARYPALWLHVRANNVAATELYLKLGMHVSQRLERFYSNGEAALVMQTPGVAVD
jgi:ribosomal-protein-alanine N-acetyltransferase